MHAINTSKRTMQIHPTLLVTCSKNQCSNSSITSQYKWTRYTVITFLILVMNQLRVVTIGIIGTLYCFNIIRMTSVN